MHHIIHQNLDEWFPIKDRATKKYYSLKFLLLLLMTITILKDDYEHLYKPHISYLYRMSCYTDTMTWSTSLYYKKPTDYK